LSDNQKGRGRLIDLLVVEGKRKKVLENMEWIQLALERLQ
jgi:hypothetical protein